MPIREDDLIVWRKWKRDKSPVNTSALLNQLIPLVKNDIARYSNNMPYAVVEVHAKELILQACENYNPNSGVALSTYVKSYMPKLIQRSGEWLGTIKVPAHRRDKYNVFKNSYETLNEKYGREPNSQELADHLGWSHAEVVRFQKELRSELSEDRPVYTNYNPNTSKEEELLDYIYHELTAEEKLLFEYRTGYGGKQKLSNPEIMKKMGWNQNQLSYKIKSLEEKIDRILNAN
jgi:DNA-directed RNA polymerase specialized sigma subunit